MLLGVLCVCVCVLSLAAQLFRPQVWEVLITRTNTLSKLQSGTFSTSHTSAT